VLAHALATDCFRARRAAALYPIDTIKTRLQLARTGGGVGALLRSGGGKALYAGVFGNLVGVAPATAVFMAIYEPLKKVLLPRGAPYRRHRMTPRDLIA